MLDLNSDLGESFGRWVLGDDEAMLGLVTWANVACGFHAGDAPTLRGPCASAAGGDRGVGGRGRCWGRAGGRPPSRRGRGPGPPREPERADRRRALPDRCARRPLPG